VGVVTDAAVAAAPLTGEAAPFVVMGAASIRAILSLAEQLGEGDAVRALLDSELATARQATDAALDAKYAKP
jgi:ferritin-like metal-binding protein YciE